MMNEDLQRKQLKVRKLAVELADMAKFAKSKNDIKELDEKLNDLKKWVRILSDELEKS